MIEQTLRDRLDDFGPTNSIEQENVLQELLQNFVLAALARARFFSHAAFHGGTCLRILYGTSRFSEDLDFAAKEPDAGFRWTSYLDKVARDCEEDGIRFEVQDKTKAEASVKKVFLKTDSIDQIMTESLPFDRRTGKKIRIKLEIDTNPPAGAVLETQYITFPVTAAITTMTLESGFAGKLHALLCRGYTKGRDWYDFLWYVTKKVSPERRLLENALHQQGPWAGEGVRVTDEWLVDALRTRIGEIDWSAARDDVSRFVPAREQEGIGLWAPDLFLSRLDLLADYMSPSS